MDSYLKLDWLSFTFKPETDWLGDGSDKDIVDLFLEFFPEFVDIIDEMPQLGGRLHYTNSMKWNDDFMILYNVPSASMESSTARHLWNMGLNVSIPSHSLHLFFDMMHIDTSSASYLADTIALLTVRHCQVSRIDLCYDDYEKKYRPLDYYKFWMDDRIKSHFMRIDIVGTGKSVGNTLYLGSLKKRTKLLRIYDKDYQTGGDVDSVRYEFELHAEYAREMADYILEHTQLSFGDYLINNWFSVLESGHSSSNKGMIPVDSDWLDYVKLRFNANVVPKVPNYVPSERAKYINKFIEHSVLPSLKGFVELYGMDKILEMLRDTEISPKYQAYIKSLEVRGERWKHCNYSPFDHLDW